MAGTRAHRMLGLNTVNSLEFRWLPSALALAGLLAGALLPAGAPIANDERPRTVLILVPGQPTGTQTNIDAFAAGTRRALFESLPMGSSVYLDAACYLREEMPACKLIFLTMTHDADLAREAMRIGASGYLLKTSAGWELFEAVDSALRGRPYVIPTLRRALERQPAAPASRASSSELTTRQREVLRLLAQGRSMKQAAAALGLTPRTVAFHKYQMMGKFRLGSNAELVQFPILQAAIT